MATYKIVRIYKDLNMKSKLMKRGLSLQDAQSHCRDKKTMKKGVYFDSYTLEVQ